MHPWLDTEGSPRNIPNEELRVEDCPPPGTAWTWPGVEAFALTFNGYEYWGSDKEYQRVMWSKNPQSLAEARTALFHRQRAWRHSSHTPTHADLLEVETLLGKIRQYVQAPP